MRTIILLVSTFLLLIGNNAILCFPNIHTKFQAAEDPGVTRLREYLRINSAHPNPDYESCITWLRNQAEEIGLDFHLEYFEQPTDLFALWLTWNGSNPDLKSILINSHMDVVAVDLSKWNHDPFEAFKDEEGNIFGRGAVDMKSATVGVLEAIRRLKQDGFSPLRSIHISVLPDEELGGHRGMKPFSKSQHFSSLNVGFDIDEGFVNPTNDMFITYAEKSSWKINFTAKGMAAHASTLPAETAGQKLQIVIDRMLEFRASQLELMEEPDVTIENVTSLNLVRLGGGLGNNIIPDELWATFDIRILRKPGWNYTDVEDMFDRIIEETGPDVSYNYIMKSMEHGQTAVDETNVWWTEIVKSCGQLNITCTPQVFSGATDGRYVRDIGIPVFGISPFLQTPQTAHQDNEFINEKNFLGGVNRYAVLIQNVASVSSEVEAQTKAQRFQAGSSNDDWLILGH